MQDWRPEEMSSRFLAIAEQSEHRLQELQAKLHTSTVYKHEFDEVLAAFFVYNYLHGRTYLETRAAFCAELQRMLKNIPNPFEGNQERFEAHYRVTVNRLREAYCEASE